MMTINLSRVFSHLVGAYVVISTLFYLPVSREMPTREALDFGYMVQELFFRYGALFVIAFTWMMKPLRRMNCRELVFLFLFCGFVSIFYGYQLPIRRVILNIFVGLLFLKAVCEYYDLRDLKIIGYWIMGIIIANSLLGAAQYFGYDPIYVIKARMGKLEYIAGFMKLKVHLSVLAALSAPLMMLVHPLFVLVAIPALIFGFSSTAVMCFVISMAVYLFMQLWRDSIWKKSVFVLLAVLFIGAGLFYVIHYDMPTGQFGERFKVWFMALSHFMRANMFFGVGLGGFAQWGLATDQLTAVERLSWIWAHNEYLQFAFETGFVGVAFVLVFARNKIMEFIEFRENKHVQILFLSVFTLMGISLFHFPFHVGRFAPLALLILGLYQASVEDARCK